MLQLLLDFDAHLGVYVELVCSMSVFGESLGEIETDCLKWPAATEMGMIEHKQCEDELDRSILFFHLIRFS